MKSVFTILFFTLFGLGFSFSQTCFPSGAFFFNQFEVDSFQINNPGCTIIDGNVVIGGSVQNLDSLHVLTEIAGELRIESDFLTNMNGLTSLTTIGDNLYIKNSNSLVSFEGLESLNAIGGSLKAENSPSLLSFEGLESLNSIGLSLEIDNCDGLLNLNGMESLTTIEGNFYIENCDALTNTSGLESLTFVGSRLNISENPQLENFTGLESLTTIMLNVTIENNDNLVNFAGLNNLTTIGGHLYVNYNESLFNLEGLSALTSIGNSFLLHDNNLLANLNGLNSLVTIGGTFGVNHNPALNSLAGLDHLKYIGIHFQVSYNPLLTTFEGVDSLKVISNEFFVTDNPSLTSFSGLESLDSIEQKLIIIANQSLASLDGLNTLSYVGNDFFIQLNSSLTSISGLESLTEIGGIFNINNNELLASLVGLESLTTVGGSLFIENNSALTNFNGLSSLSTIGEFFYLLDNASLTSFEGMDALSLIGDDFQIVGNNSLTSFSGLNSLINIEGYLEVRENQSLISFSGLESLTSIGEYFRVSSSNDLISFAGLESLNTIGQYLFVTTNLSLINFEGLTSLNNIGSGIRVENNPSLINFTGLNALVSNGGEFSVKSNPQLTTFEGLESLNSVSGDFEIYNNSVLESFKGLESLVSINGTFDIRDNPSLTTLLDLFNLDYLSLSDLIIKNNELLTLCEASGICNYLNNGGPATIENNDSRCNTIDEIKFYCNFINKVYFPTFIDENENGVQDAGEPLFADVKLNIAPNGISVYGNAQNGGVVYLEDGNYTFTIDTSYHSDWTLTSDSVSFSLDVGNASIDTITFGLFAANENSNLNSFVTSPPFRCNEMIVFDVIAKNEGSTIADGTLWFTMDEHIIDFDYIDIPDTISPPDKIGWHFYDLWPGESVHKQIRLKIPGPPEFDLGNYLSFFTYLDYTDGISSDLTDRFIFSEIVQCSYDPNDKLVNPVYPNNYALMGEDLVYTIRFQNTGNAEAYDVIIRDTLDEYLDPSTFSVIGSSHEEVLSTTLAEGKYLTFTFHDIYLPDSTSNFDESQGYVAYRIKAFEGIPEETVINNSAGIYFDLNPPVITNTTENVMLSTFDFDEDGFDIFEDCDDSNPDINPDAEEIPNNGIDENCDGLDVPVSTNDHFNQLIKIYPNPFSEFLILETQFEKESKINIEIVDILGNILLVNEKNLLPGTNRFPLEINNHFSDGFYQIKITNESGYLFSQKIIHISK